MRSRNHQTITGAVEVAVRAAKRDQSMMYVISAQTADGEFEGEYAVAQHTGCDREDAYIIVDALGRSYEGPKARELPINAA